MAELEGQAGAAWSVPLDRYGTAPAIQSTASDRTAVVQGLGLGVVAAVVSAWAWAMIVVVTGYRVGIVAVGVALLIGTAVRFGSRGAAGPTSRAGSVVLTLLAMAAAEYLTVRHLLNELAAVGIIDRIPVLVAPADALAMVAESLAADPVTLPFWAIAVFSAWRYGASTDAAPQVAGA
jgi:hypothetical protein